MRKFLGVLFVAALTAVVAVRAPAGETAKCDLKHVVEAVYCDHCKAFLSPDQVVDKSYCKACSGDKTGDERVMARHVKACQKTYYTCAADNVTSWKPQACEKCEAELTKVVDLALVGFKCEGCGKASEKAGFCTEPECAKAHKKIVMACTKSGAHPHVPETATP